MQSKHYTLSYINKRQNNHRFLRLLNANFLDHSHACTLSFFLEYPEKYKCYGFLEVTKGHLSSDWEYISFTELFLIRHGLLDVNSFILLRKLDYFRILIGLFYSPKFDSFCRQALHFFKLHESKWVTKLKPLQIPAMTQT